MPDIQDRVRRGCQFEDHSFYLSFGKYFNVTGKLHSVVETKRGWWLVRVWRATKLGPPNYEAAHQSKMFRISQESFRRYIVPPDPKIAKAVNVKGKYQLMEIALFDEHKIIAESLRPDDYVVILNVHFAHGQLGESLNLHGGSNKYDRGLWAVPEDCEDRHFLQLKNCIEKALEDVVDYENFIEFEPEPASPQVLPALSKQESPYFSPMQKLKVHRWNQFAEGKAREIGAVTKSVGHISVGKQIAVDWFSKREYKKYCFLTHAHSDHCNNLNSKWTNKVYCSEDTAKILPLVMGYSNADDVPANIIVPLALNVAHKFDGFTVTLVDANHCFGAVMFIFEGPAIPGECVLCTGDFRADKTLMEKFEVGKELHFMTQKMFHCIYIDNTYLNVDVPFPERADSSLIMRDICQSNPTKDIYIPLHRLGREEAIEGLSREMQEPIEVYEDKRAIGNTAGFFFGFGIPNRNRTIRVVKRNKWQLTEEEKQRDFHIIDITMLNYLTASDSIVEMYKDRVTHVAYSDHSSRAEIISFLKQLHFMTVVPHAKAALKVDMEMMEKCSRSSTIASEDTGKVLSIECEKAPNENGISLNAKLASTMAPVVEVRIEDIPLPDTPEIKFTLDDGIPIEAPTSSRRVSINSVNIELEPATLSPSRKRRRLETAQEESNQVELVEDAMELKDDELYRNVKPQWNSPAEEVHISPVKKRPNRMVVSSPQHQETCQEIHAAKPEENNASICSPQSKESSNATSPSAFTKVQLNQYPEEKDSDEDVLMKEQLNEDQVTLPDEILENMVSEEDDTLVEDEIAAPTEEPESSDYSDWDEDPVERELDKWSIGPPKSLAECFARLQEPPYQRKTKTHAK